MNVVSTREQLNEALHNLDSVRNNILRTSKYIEEMVRVNEMCAAMLAFSALDDDEILSNINEIGRIRNAVSNYAEFMNNSF